MMKPSHQRLSSWLLLAGVVAGFALATWQGRLAATYSKPAGFRRFHQRLSPDTLFYPPYAMMETLALARWQPGQTLVLVGGNSILNGVGQPADDVWTLRLQSLLGDGYVVVNLAMRSANPAQAGALVAESLQRRGIPLIYVTNTTPTAGAGLAAGEPLGYLYWQARAQGKIDDYAPRHVAVQQWEQNLPAPAREKLAEEKLGAQIDACTGHQSLWHHLGYRHVFTVWNFLLRGDSWTARQRLADNEPAARPVAERFQDYFAEEMALVRGNTEWVATRDAGGHWQFADPARQQLVAGIDAAFVPALRPRMLMLLELGAPPYLAALTPDEHARSHTIYAACAQIWREQGIACFPAGENFEPADYIDRAHLSRDGGDKLAAFVAEKIRQFPPP